MSDTEQNRLLLAIADEDCDPWLAMQVKELVAENARLREALEKIEYLDSPQIRGLPSRSSIHEIAKAALAKEVGE